LCFVSIFLFDYLFFYGIKAKGLEFEPEFRYLLIFQLNITHV
jgi:hypothetical protein